MFFHHQLPEQEPGVAAGKFRIVTDGECIPEANPDFQWYRDPAEYWWNGWLVSLLMADWIIVNLFNPKGNCSYLTRNCSQSSILMFKTCQRLSNLHSGTGHSRRVPLGHLVVVTDEIRSRHHHHFTV